MHQLTDLPTLAVEFEVFVVMNTKVAFGTQRGLIVIDMRLRGAKK
jgi:hypothetical protein